MVKAVALLVETRATMQVAHRRAMALIHQKQHHNLRRLPLRAGVLLARVLVALLLVSLLVRLLLAVRIRLLPVPVLTVSLLVVTLLVVSLLVIAWLTLLSVTRLPGLRSRLGAMADRFHGSPSKAMVTVGVTYGAPHHLVADSAITGGVFVVRRTAGGDAWAALQEQGAEGAVAKPSVSLGMPRIGAPETVETSGPACGL